MSVFLYMVLAMPSSFNILVEFSQANFEIAWASNKTEAKVG